MRIHKVFHLSQMNPHNPNFKISLRALICMTYFIDIISHMHTSSCPTDIIPLKCIKHLAIISYKPLLKYHCFRSLQTNLQTAFHLKKILCNWVGFSATAFNCTAGFHHTRFVKNIKDLHKKLFFAVFGLKLDLEAGGGDFTGVFPVLQVLLVLFLTFRWGIRGSCVLHLKQGKT